MGGIERLEKGEVCKTIGGVGKARIKKTEGTTHVEKGC